MKIILTGATGMVGEGVLHECLNHPQIESVLIINRRSAEAVHPKLKELVHSDFYDLSSIEDQLKGYDACFFCLGVSSVGVSKEDYYKMTYTLTLQMGTTLSRINPGSKFLYISGKGTDSAEKGTGWAAVKGKTENDLRKLPFKEVYGVRPGFIKPIKGMKRTIRFYKYVLWMFPIGRALFPSGFCTLQELAAAMIHVALNGNNHHAIEGMDIIRLAKSS